MRDASGNVIAVYKSENGNDPILEVAHIYGSSRIGMQNAITKTPQIFSITSGFGTAFLSTFTRGEKIFELSNHLGNVLETVNDKKIAFDDDADDVIDYYEADVITANDYYPFGMLMVGRIYQMAKGTYRYSINGQEKSSEVAPNTTTAEYWEYDSRIVRRWNIDKVYKNSPYEVYGGNPILYSDPLGLDTIGFNKHTTIVMPKQNRFGQKPSAKTTFAITTKPAEGNDIYIYNNSVTKVTDDGITTTTTSTILNPNSNQKSGVTKGKNLYFDGLITTERNNKDWETVGKFMNLDKGFNDYMVGRHPESALWRARALAIESGELLFPVLIQNGLGAWIGYSVIGTTSLLSLESSVSVKMGNTYKALGEVTVPIKNTELLNALNSSSKGNWIKVYEAGLQNGNKLEVHYFRNTTTGAVYDVKTKYDYWHQKAFKMLNQ